MEQVFLSDTELYFTDAGNISEEKLLLFDEEVHHIAKVMRHKEGDEIYVTSGKGIIWKVKISGIGKKKILCDITDQIEYKKSFGNMFFCLPLMKSNDRLEFAVEKLTELGFTEFIIYSSGKGSSRNVKLDRLDKIVLAAMKQSLRAFLPKIEYSESLVEVFRKDGRKIVFDQKAITGFKEFIKSDYDKESQIYLIIGPEAGFSEDEYSLFRDSAKVKLIGNRLRTETAAISSGIILSQLQ